MALQGTLETFALPDVLRLLASTKKTGAYRLDGDRGTGRLWLEDGQVIGGEFEGSATTDANEVAFELLRFSDGDAMVEAACMGLGVAQLPSYMVSEAIAAGRLVELLPGLRPPTLPIHALMPATRLVPPRVRVLLDALVELRDNSPRDRAATSVRGRSSRNSPARVAVQSAGKRGPRPRN